MTKLVGCIKTLTWNTIKTKWYYIDEELNTIKDVSTELFQTIEKFNKDQKNIAKDTGKYAMQIPYSYTKDGYTKYSFGCGLSHYLQQDLFSKLKEVGKELSFDIGKCILQMYTPKDLKVNNSNIEKLLLK